MQGGGGQRGETREGRGLRSEEHLIGPLLKEVLPGGGAGLRGQVSGEAELLLALLVLHLLQLLRGLHLGQLLALLTHLLEGAESLRQ